MDGIFVDFCQAKAPPPKLSSSVRKGNSSSNPPNVVNSNRRVSGSALISSGSNAIESDDSAVCACNVGESNSVIATEFLECQQKSYEDEKITRSEGNVDKTDSIPDVLETKKVNPASKTKGTKSNNEGDFTSQDDYTRQKGKRKIQQEKEV